MRDPVVCADGHSYERANIEYWLMSHDTSPQTGSLLESKSVVPNHALRNSIEELIERTFKMVSRSSITVGDSIGAGAFKTVHDGSLHGQRVAILKMRTGVQIGDELKALIKLGRHPNLVRFLGLCAEGPQPLIITEFAPLGSLDNFLSDREGQVPMAPKMAMVQQICSGMAAIAEQALLHRDLAARNVLVFAYDAASARTTLVKISDFGLAISSYGATHAYGNQREQVPFRWMPPEALRRRKFSEKSDVWAFGVTLWELMTDAEIPYALVPSDETVAERVIAGMRLSEPPNCPAWLWTLMLSCWADTADARPKFQELLVEMMQKTQSTGASPAASSSEPAVSLSSREVQTKQREERAALREERDLISRFDSTKLQVGQIWYLVEASWLRHWREYAWDASRTDSPGPICNEKLLQGPNTTEASMEMCGASFSVGTVEGHLSPATSSTSTRKRFRFRCCTCIATKRKATRRTLRTYIESPCFVCFRCVLSSHLSCPGLTFEFLGFVTVSDPSF